MIERAPRAGRYGFRPGGARTPALRRPGKRKVEIHPRAALDAAVVIPVHARRVGGAELHEQAGRVADPAARVRVRRPVEYVDSVGRGDPEFQPLARLEA